MTLQRIMISSLACMLSACPATVVTTSGPPPSRPPPPYERPPSAPSWNSTGWTLLGSQWVDGKHDRDVIRVGAYEGHFDKLTMVVTESDLVLNSFVVVFANGERWAPTVQHTFGEGTRTRTLDLPGADRTIKEIELAYSNLPGGGRAKVEIYAKDQQNRPVRPPVPPPVPPPVEPPPPPVVDFSPVGWTLIGSQWVDGKRDKDLFPVGRAKGHFDRIMIVVKESELQMLDFIVTFDNGEKFDPKVDVMFKQGMHTRAIDLPGNDRYIKNIAVKYANLPGGGKARVEIYAIDTKKNYPDKPPAPAAPGFDSKGWTSLGSQWVTGTKDNDVFPVGRGKGRFDRIVVAVTDSDLQMLDFVITFENGEKFDPKLNVKFKEGMHTRAIDLPSTDRYIKDVKVKYANIPGGGKARVEIWGKDTNEGKDPKKPTK